jgi:lysophospholipid acyltransferase (LPLAT)-like uncharacterized protein
VIYVVWHGGLLPALWKHRRESTTVLVSDHRDGSRLASAIEKWGYRTVRGSTTRGGARGLLGIMRVLDAGGNVALTPDGPRGPARRAKPGAVMAAQRTGARIIPVAASASPGWRLGSWDGFLIPQPFARVRIAYDAPITVSRGEALEEGLERLQRGLDQATRLAECAA